jgi:phospholipid/cholesterol/gamma-HCH transport system substrate-binding protein
VVRPGDANDLVELTRRMPRLASLTSTVFPRTRRTLSQSQPVIDYARLYTPDVVGWLTKFGQVAAGYDANGHYARIQPVFSPYKFNEATRMLSSLPAGAGRLAAFQKGKSRRCPGAAGGAAPDGSAPLQAPDCDPSATPGAR